MNRRTFLASAAAAAFAQPAARPNFVVIYSDDQGYGDVGCFGAADMKTPHLDRLAARGVRFTDWYSNSPVCSPSRASLMTGKYPQRTGIVSVLNSEANFNVPGLRQGETSLAAGLRSTGYRTGHVGKWHLGSAAHSRPAAQGFDEFFGFLSGWTDYYSHRYYRQGAGGSEIFHDLWHNDREVFHDAEYHTELFSRRAAEWIGQQKGQPFFLTLAYGAPHFPMMAPRRYWDRFPDSMDRDRRMHASTIAAMDDGIGLVLDSLRKSGALDNTVVFFQSDNGATSEIRADHRGRPYEGGSNKPLRGHKAQLFDGGIRVPAILSWPSRMASGRVISQPGAAMDILPTFLEWAGAKPPAGIDGRSVARMALDDGPSPHEAIFWEYGKQQAVREGDWKLVVNPPGIGAPVWLSNVASDVSESRNLAASDPEVVKRLQERLAAWRASVS